MRPVPLDVQFHKPIQRRNVAILPCERDKIKQMNSAKEHTAFTTKALIVPMPCLFVWVRLVAQKSQCQPIRQLPCVTQQAAAYFQGPRHVGKDYIIFKPHHATYVLAYISRQRRDLFESC